MKDAHMPSVSYIASTDHVQTIITEWKFVHYNYRLIHIKTHDSESRGQEEAGRT